MDFQRSALPTTLRWASVLLCVAMAGLLYWALTPMVDTTVEVVKPLPPKRSVVVAPDQLLQPAQLASVWSRSLQGRRAVAKPVEKAKPKMKPVVKPAVKVATAPRAPVSLGVRLVGTVIEPGANLAIASDSEGTLSFRSEGEKFRLKPRGLLVESINDAGVWVRYKGKRIQWTVGEDLRLSSTSRQAAAASVKRATASSDMQESDLEMMGAGELDTSELNSDDGGNDIEDERTPIRPEEFPKMSLEDELDFLNG